jgi:acetyl esterase/lipase
MPSIQAKITRKFLQLQTFGWAKGSIAQQRARQEKNAGIFKIPAGITVEKKSLDGIPAELINVENPANGIILYLHGGAYAVGSVNVHREYLSRLAKACQVKVLAIDYRLAPEYPFPAALEDSLTAYHWLIAQGYDPASIVLAGDSAGGGLAIAAMVSLRDDHKPLPACAVCVSPWLNLCRTGSKVNNNHDPILNPEILSLYSHYYAGQTDPGNPLISPIYADLRGLPPIFIQAGTNEILLDQIEEFCEKARLANIEIVFDLYQGLFHVFQIIPILPESTRSLEEIAKFIGKKINRDM